MKLSFPNKDCLEVCGLNDSSQLQIKKQRYTLFQVFLRCLGFYKNTHSQTVMLALSRLDSDTINKFPPDVKAIIRKILIFKEASGVKVFHRSEEISLNNQANIEVSLDMSKEFWRSPTEDSKLAAWDMLQLDIREVDGPIGAFGSDVLSCYIGNEEGVVHIIPQSLFFFKESVIGNQLKHHCLLKLVTQIAQHFQQEKISLRLDIDHEVNAEEQGILNNYGWKFAGGFVQDRYKKDEGCDQSSAYYSETGCKQTYSYLVSSDQSMLSSEFVGLITSQMSKLSLHLSMPFFKERKYIECVEQQQNRMRKLIASRSD